MPLKSKVLYNLPIILFVVDSDYKIQYKNEEFISWFGDASTKELGGIINCENYVENLGCRNSARCGACELRKALYDCIELNKVVYKRLIQKKVALNGKNREINFKISVKKIDQEEKKHSKDLYICIVDDAVEVSSTTSEDIKLDRKLLHDLNKASSMQQEMLPIYKEVKGIKFDYIYSQCFPIGGDFLNVYEIDEDHIGGFVADVSGHGMSSGLLTMFLNEVYDVKSLEPKNILTSVQSKFENFRFSSNQYITIIAFVIDVKNRIIKFSNAGHTTPLTIIRDGKILEYSLNGTPISTWFTKYNFDEATIQYNKGDKLVAYTDGATDLKNHEGYQFGAERFKNLLKANEDINQMIKNINDELTGFASEVKTKIDDITVLALQLN